MNIGIHAARIHPSPSVSLINSVRTLTFATLKCSELLSQSLFEPGASQCTTSMTLEVLLGALGCSSATDPWFS